MSILTVGDDGDGACVCSLMMMVCMCVLTDGDGVCVFTDGDGVYVCGGKINGLHMVFVVAITLH